MTMRLVLLAADRADAHEWVAAQPWLRWSDVTVVTRRSPGAAHGVTADAVIATPAAQALPEDAYLNMVNHSYPSAMTGGPR